MNLLPLTLGNIFGLNMKEA